MRINLGELDGPVYRLREVTVKLMFVSVDINKESFYYILGAGWRDPDIRPGLDNRWVIAVHERYNAYSLCR